MNYVESTCSGSALFKFISFLCVTFARDYQVTDGFFSPLSLLLYATAFGQQLRYANFSFRLIDVLPALPESVLLFVT